MRNIYQTPSHALASVMYDCAEQPVYGSRGGPMREIIGHSFTVINPGALPQIYQNVKGRNLNPKIGALEALQLIGQTSMPELMTTIKAFEPFTNDGVFEGAYGARLQGQFRQLIETLSQPNSRQAVLTIFDSRRDPMANSRDVPCTIALQFFIRDEAMHLMVTMRSNDAWLGLPYDMHQFIALQAAVAAHFGLRLGHYHHSVGSMHVYERDVTKVDGVTFHPFLGDKMMAVFTDYDIEVLSRWARDTLMGRVTTSQVSESSFMTFMRGAIHG